MDWMEAQTETAPATYRQISCADTKCCRTIYVTSLSQFETIFPIMTLDFRRPMAEPLCVLPQPSVTLCGNDCTYPRWSSFNFANTIPKDFCLAWASPLGHIQKTMHQRNVYRSAWPLSTVVRMASPDILTAETTSSAMRT